MRRIKRYDSSQNPEKVLELINSDKNKTPIKFNAYLRRFCVGLCFILITIFGLLILLIIKVLYKRSVHINENVKRILFFESNI
jgi:hypothetical protein